MGKLISFNFITLDGYFEGPERGDISWHQHDAEGNEFASQNVQSGPATLIFGRVTYEMMFGFWNSDMGKQQNPIVAEGMRSSEKLVFSRKLKRAGWENSRIVSEDIGEEIRKQKAIPEKNMTILGSGSIVAQLADLRLIDEFHVLIDPVAIGKGRTLFEGLKSRLQLKLLESRTFKSGTVLHVYQNPQ